MQGIERIQSVLGRQGLSQLNDAFYGFSPAGYSCEERFVQCDLKTFPMVDSFGKHFETQEHARNERTLDVIQQHNSTFGDPSVLPHSRNQDASVKTPASR